MLGIINLTLLYFAFIVVITIHELGHFPKSIKSNWGIIPSAAAIQAKYRLGGLIANVLLFYIVFWYKPESLILQYVGLVSWLHFMVYSILGSIIPEKKESNVNIKTYVFDDVPNEYAVYFWMITTFVFITLKDYYLPILLKVIA